MPRASKAEKARNHQRIIEEASRQIRSNGIEGLGIADLMKSVGMTHGGFYRHFKDKEDLSVAAINHAFDSFSQRLEGEIAEKGARPALETFLDRYLSTEHVENPSIGCPAAALSGDAGRCSASEKKAIFEGVEKIKSLLGAALEETAPPTKLTVDSLFSLIVGTVVLARAADSEPEANKALEKTRLFLGQLQVI